MNIEIIEFYPIDGNLEKGILTGTLRAKLPDLGLHILGIYVSKRKDCYFFQLPGSRGTHHETGESIRYPYIAFEDRDQQQQFISEIRERGCEFIEARLSDKENPIVFPIKKEGQIGVSQIKEAVSFSSAPSKAINLDKSEEDLKKLESKQMQPEPKSVLSAHKPSKLAALDYRDLPPLPKRKKNSKLAMR